MAAADPNSAPDMLAEALAYLRAGYPVFPVCSPLMGAHEHYDRFKKRMAPCPPDKRGKNPMVRWKDCQEELPEEWEVISWWTKWPNANIGFATGSLSGILVLDADGTDARRECLKRGGLDKTRAVWTGKVGGAHFHLAYPGEEARNFARRIPGTDLRGEGGYALLPPSLHARGSRYRWIEGTRDLDPSPTPDWLLDVIRSKSTSSESGEYGEGFDTAGALNGFDEGHRDDGLFRFACRLRQEDQPIGYAEALIRQAAANCRPPFSDDEAIAKVHYVYQKYEPGNVGPTMEDDGWFSPPGVIPASIAPSDPLEGAIDEEEAAPWKVYDAADFLKIEYPVVQWRIPGFLREQAILFNFGAPGSIKTYIATDAALAVSTGGMFLGKYLCEQGRVLIVQEDTLDSDFQQAYLAPLVRARGIDPEELRGQLFIAPPGGMALDIPDRVKDLCAWLESFKPDLLIIDAFYLMHSSDGYGKDLVPIMKRIKTIRRVFGCAIWVIDHDRKGKNDGISSENAVDRLWGGRHKSAAVDAIMESKPVKGAHGETFLDIVKLRGAKPAEPIRVKLHEDYRLTVDGEGESEHESPSGTKLAVYEWLCREGGSRTKAQISTGVDLSLRSVEAALYELSRDGLAKKVGKIGRAETWIALRKSEAEPASYGPDFDWGEEE